MLLLLWARQLEHESKRAFLERFRRGIRLICRESDFRGFCGPETGFEGVKVNPCLHWTARKLSHVRLATNSNVRSTTKLDGPAPRLDKIPARHGGRSTIALASSAQAPPCEIALRWGSLVAPRPVAQGLCLIRARFFVSLPRRFLLHGWGFLLHALGLGANAK